MKRSLLVCAFAVTVIFSVTAFGQNNRHNGWRDHQRNYRSDGHHSRYERRQWSRDDRDFRRFRRNDDRRYSKWQKKRFDREHHTRGNGYYRRGAGSRSHPVFGRR
jgi:hypothetical protein